jgi:hypothetical protein
MMIKLMYHRNCRKLFKYILTSTKIKKSMDLLWLNWRKYRISVGKHPIIGKKQTWKKYYSNMIKIKRDF